MEDWHTVALTKKNEQEKQEEEWIKERDAAFDKTGSDQTEYDKQLLTLSSGFLAVSLAFIKDIVPLASARCLWSLYLSFLLFAVCIMVVLFSYQFSISANVKVKEYYDKKLAGYIDPKFPNLHALLVTWVNRASGIVFALGVCSIVTFVIINLRTEADMAHDNRKGGLAEDGAPVKVPYQPDYLKKGQQIKTPPPPPPPPPPKK
jgi:hypothetical protein